jgi:transcriptional antiterminator NusG
MIGRLVEADIDDIRKCRSGDWYGVYTRSNFEKIVAADLCVKGVDVYLPTIREIHRWRDRRKEIEKPIFPGYVFVNMMDTPANRLRVLRSTGTVRILGNGGEIEPIPELEIEAIRRLLESEMPFCVHPFLREGAWVRVKYGPLRGVEGTLVRIKNKERLVLSVQMLAQSVATEIDGSDVEVLRAPPPRAGVGLSYDLCA